MNPPADPRTARTREAVIDATACLLAELGFERITVDAIAERCGIARSTIYRNFDDPSEVLIQAFRRICAVIAPPDHGSARADLEAFGRDLAKGLTSEPMGQALPSLIGAAAHDERLRRLQQEFSAERREEALHVLRRAVDRGEIPPDRDLVGPLMRFVAPFFFHRLVTQLPLDEEFVAGQVDAICRELGIP